MEAGTIWVAPGEGSTGNELDKAFGYTPRCLSMSNAPNFNFMKRTNLKLTGAPISKYDRERWESGNVE